MSDHIPPGSIRSRMALRSPEWGRLTANWDALVDLLKSEIETRNDGMAPRTYVEIKRLLADGVPCPTCGAPLAPTAACDCDTAACLRCHRSHHVERWPSEYICRSCSRVVDPDLEPSPGEPTRCADCYADALRDWGTEAW